MTDVLLFGTMGDIGPVVRDNLLAHGLEVELVGFPQPTVRDAFGYRRGLLNAVRQYSPALVLPIGDTRNAAALKTEFAALFPGAALCVETAEKVEMLAGKLSCYAFAEGLGILQPRRFLDAETVPDGLQTVFKSDRSFGSQGIHFPWTREALANLVSRQSPRVPYLIEAFVSGREYSIDIFRSGGKCTWGIYECCRPEGSGAHVHPDALVRRPAECPCIVAPALKIMEAADFCGVCGFDFIVDAQGEPYLLECNPRFTGGLRTQIEAGFEIPWLLYRSFS